MNEIPTDIKSAYLIYRTWFVLSYTIVGSCGGTVAGLIISTTSRHSTLESFAFNVGLGTILGSVIGGVIGLVKDRHVNK